MEVKGFPIFVISDKATAELPGSVLGLISVTDDGSEATYQCPPKSGNWDVIVKKKGEKFIGVNHPLEGHYYRSSSIEEFMLSNPATNPGIYYLPFAKPRRDFFVEHFDKVSHSGYPHDKTYVYCDDCRLKCNINWIDGVVYQEVEKVDGEYHLVEGHIYVRPKKEFIRKFMPTIPKKEHE